LLAIAAASLLVGAIILALSNPSYPVSHLALTLGVWLTSFTVAHLYLSRCLPHRDPFLLPAVALLTGLGLLLIGRLALNFLLRQTVWLLVATGALTALVRLSRDLRWLRRFRYTWLFGGLALLAATLVLGVNPSGYGPRLWLGAFGVYFQPAEPLKLLMIAYLASYLAERQGLLISEGRKIGRWQLPPLAYVGPLLAMFGLAVVILAWQQDLGAAMLFFFTFLGLLYLATGQWEYAAMGLALFLIAGAAGYQLSTKVALRIDSWLNPWPEAAGRAFQIVQSLQAFAAGGILGQGLGMGNPAYIPAVHTDFVFAAAGEELGLAGVLVIIALYGVLLVRGARTAARARQPFERFLAAGLTAGLAIQAWVIMAGNAKLAPIAGVTLPFISYGGSSLLISFITLALILRISHQSAKHRRAEQTKEREGTTDGSINKAAGSRLGKSRPINRQILHLTCVLSLALAILAATCGYWAIARAEPLRARDDNPRRVLYEQRILRGSILDRKGAVLAHSEATEGDAVERRYPAPEAAPAIGYASLRHGTGGVEEAFDAVLRGEAGRTAWQAAWDDLLQRPPSGQDVQVTLDADLQVQAQRALRGHAGAVVLLDAASGDVLAMASNPTFAPERLDERWEELSEDANAPLVNRATQGLYQPGTALQTIVLAEALTRRLTELSAPAPDAAQTLSVNGGRLGCSATISQPYTLAEAYSAACPAPFADLGERLGPKGMAQAIERWKLTVTPPPLEVPTEAADWYADVLSTTAALRAEAIGQGELVVSPLQMALVAGTLANEGVMPAPRLALRVQEADGAWYEHSSLGEPESVIAPSIALSLLAGWKSYGDGVAGHWGAAMAGEEKSPHAWFLGVAPEEAPRYAVAILLEHPADPQRAMEIGNALLRAASSR